MDFTELDFIEGLFALLEKQGITNFNKEDLDKTIIIELENSKIFNFAHADITLSLGLDIFRSKGIIKNEDQYQLAFKEDYMDKVIAKLTQEQVTEINRIIKAYQNTLPGSINIDELTKLILSCFKDDSFHQGKTALPADYKIGIEEMMYSDEFKKIFSPFINLTIYDDNIDVFLTAFAKSLEKFVQENQKNVSYDFFNDAIEIDFTQDEKNNILSEYDIQTINRAKYFCNLIKRLPYDAKVRRQLENSNNVFRKKFMKYLNRNNTIY